MELCAPALIYIVFSLTQIIIDTFKGFYNTAFFKSIVMIMVTILLNALCKNNMSIISWIIVFIPFIFMTVIITILLYVFGLDAATGTLKMTCDVEPNEQMSGNLIYSSTDISTDISTNNEKIQSSPPSGTSDPQYS